MRKEKVEEFFTKIVGKRIKWRSWNKDEYIIPKCNYRFNDLLDRYVFTGIDEEGVEKYYYITLEDIEKNNEWLILEIV